jgi:hypothetical protein
MKYAKEIASEIGINNYEVSYVKPEELPKHLAKCKYGFIIRQEDIVNNVATPTKLSTYLSCGLIPVMTEAVRDYVDLFKEKEFAVISNENIAEAVLEFSSKTIEADAVFSEYQEIFQTYYCDEYHIERISELLETRLP